MWKNLVAYRIYPSQWAIAEGGTVKATNVENNPFLSIFGQVTGNTNSRSAMDNILWTGDTLPTPADTESALLLLEQKQKPSSSAKSTKGSASIFPGWYQSR